jgi:hypothetical protein
MFKYKLYYNGEDSTIHILSMTKKYFPEWECVATDNTEENSKYSKVIVIINNLMCSSGDKKTIDAATNLMKFFYNSIGLCNYDLVNDPEYDKLF